MISYVLWCHLSIVNGCFLIRGFPIAMSIGIVVRGRYTTWHWKAFTFAGSLVCVFLCGYWLVVDLPLWKIWVRQLGWLFPIYGKIKNVPNHQPNAITPMMGQNKSKPAHPGFSHQKTSKQLRLVCHALVSPLVHLGAVQKLCSNLMVHTRILKVLHGF